MVPTYSSKKNTYSLAETKSTGKKKKKGEECTALKSKVITKAVIFTGLYPRVLLWHCNPHTSE